MSTDLFNHPSIILIIGGLILFLFDYPVRRWLTVVFSGLAFYLVFNLHPQLSISVNYASLSLQLLKVDALSKVFALIFALITLIGSIYAFHNQNRGEQIAALFYAAGALGVTLAGDFFSLFIFWEFMAASSFFLVLARRTVESYKAAMRYLIYHLLGGGLLLSGILLVSRQTGLEITPLNPGWSAGPILLLLGVVLNAAMPPLHSWIVDAYPRATVTGAVFMSALTTKSAVYVLARVFSGWEVLLIMGVLMTLYGVFYAILANDIREVLAYHIISQVGYMVAGVGIGTEMALNGTSAHAFSHILYKALLFMGAGAVLQAAGSSKMSELGGLNKKLKAVLVLYLFGGFSISGFPLLNGFISKSVIVAAAEHQHIYWAMFLMQLAAVGTFLSTTLKVPYFTWFDRGETERKVAVLPFNMYLAMGITAFLCLLFGVFPSLLYNMLPYSMEYNPYSLAHLNEIVQILLFTFLAFWILKEKLRPKAFISLDLDWFYRRPAPFVRRFLVNPVNEFFIWTEKKSLQKAKMLAEIAHNPYRLFHREERCYSPDRFRLSLQTAILLVFLIFALFSLIAFFKAL